MKDIDLFQFQIEYMRKLTHIKTLLDKQANTVNPQSIQAFQNSMMEVGMKFFQNITQNPQHFMDAQAQFLNNFNDTKAKTSGYSRYFKSDMWNTIPYFQWIKDCYIKSAEWIIEIAEDETIGFEAKDRKKLLFFMHQWIDSLNPRNFPMTNPEIIAETLKTNGQNLLDGLDNFIADIERGGISMTKMDAFTIGENIANTAGDIIFKNDIMELIHYHPTTQTVFKEPIVIIPPWINKYYILDLNPDKSFIKWLVDQGHSVFCISWRNPDKSMRDIGFKDYMHDGALRAIEIANDIHDTKQANVIGYCIGGTLLSMTMAWLAGKGITSPIHTATCLTTLLDFENAGDLKVFIDSDQIESLNKAMIENGILDGKTMGATFAMLRAPDLIWNFMINNYMLGREPEPFDLLYWNSDSTNIPASMMHDYLSNLYLDNALANGTYKLDGVILDLKSIQTPSYFLATQDDHIAPCESCYAGAQLFGTTPEFVIGGSGHIAGVINPPHKNKYGYTVKNKRHDGSWWCHWNKWIISRNQNKTLDVNILTRGDRYRELYSAPGQYVLKKI